jgi:molybdopterin biosynthesis enzyme MoaB
MVNAVDGIEGDVTVGNNDTDGVISVEVASVELMIADVGVVVSGGTGIGNDDEIVDEVEGKLLMVADRGIGVG